MKANSTDAVFNEQILRNFQLFFLQCLKALPMKIIPLIFLIQFLSIPGFSQSTYTLPATDDVCPSEMATYTVTWPSGTPAPVNVIFNVTGEVQYIPNGINVTITWGNQGTGTVTADCYDANGQFISTNTCNVTIHDNPFPVITASTIVNCTEFPSEVHADPTIDPTECWLVCERSVVTYETPLNAGSTYSWTVTGAFSFTTNQNELIVTWNTYGTGSILLTETNSFGCETTVEQCIIIIKTPSAYFNTLPPSNINSGNPLVICEGTTVHFFGQGFDQGGAPIISWFWDFGDGGIAFDQDYSYTYLNNGFYTAVLTVINACGCSYSINLDIEVTPDQIVDIECASPVCEDAIEFYSTNAVCDEYYWTITNGQISPPTGPYGSTIQVQWGSGNSGPGVVSLVGVNCNTNCTTTASILIPIYSLSFPITGPNPACTNTQQIYSVPLVPGTVYTWTVTSGNATINHGQGTHEIVVDFSNAIGQVIITVDYENLFLNCGPGQSSITIDILENFSINEEDDICVGDAVTFNCSINIPGAVIRWKLYNSSSSSPFANFNGYDNFLDFTPWPYGPGIFTIAVENLQGFYCSSRQTIQFTVLDAPIAPALSTGDLEVCSNSSHLYTALALPGHYIEWEVTNNSTTTSYTGNSITVFWGTAPYEIRIYQVSNSTGCRSTNPTIVPITEITPVVPTFTGDQAPCTNSSQTYNISNFSLLHPDLIEWSIDPASAGSIVLGQNTGTIEILWNNMQVLATIKVKIVTCGNEDVPPNMGVDYEYDVNVSGLTGYNIDVSGSVCSGNALQFDITPPLTGSLPSWNWDFGDGGTSTSASPSHPYVLQSSSTANFPVTVEISDGTCSASLNTMVQIYPSPVFSVLTTSHFICPPSTPTATLTISTQQNQNYSYDWSTGSTSNSTSINAAGMYTITVTNTISSNPLLQCSTTGSLGISGCQSGPTNCPSGGYDPSFDPAILNTPECGSITLLNMDIGAAGYYLWDFGDGTNVGGTIPNIFDHFYSAAGIYQVCLNAWDASTPTLCDQYCELVEIPLYADFNFTLECGTATQYNVRFQDLSTVLPQNTIVDWDYNIIRTSPASPPFSAQLTGQNPLIGLPPGDYNITLVITDNHNYSCESEISGINIPAPPDPTFEINTVITPAPYCEEQSVVLFNANYHTGYFSLLWDFDDPDNNMDPAEYFQIYNSGNPSTWESERAFDNNGSHDVKLIVYDIYGCDYEHIEPVNIGQNDLDGILQPHTNVICPGQIANITFSNQGGLYSDLLWSNNATSNPTISVTSVGQYSVTVTNTSTGCTFQPVQYADVGHFNTPPPIIFGELQYCLNEPIVLSGDIGGYSYLWDIGILSFQSPSVSTDATITIVPPTSAGTYPISLTISDANCTLVTTVNIIVHDLPLNPNIVTTPSPPLCEGEFYDLDVTLSNPGNLYQVNWSTGASTNNISVAIANTYQATFTNAAGCTSSSTVTIHELPNLDWVVFGCFDYCTTDEITIPGSSNDYSDWFWLVEDVNGTYYTLQGSGPVSDLILGMLPAGVYTITLKVEDPNTGCSSISNPITLTVRTCPCSIIEGVNDRITCIGVDANGVGHFTFEFDVHFNSFPLPGYLTIASSTMGMGVAVLQNPTITTNPHTISGLLTYDPSIHVASFCVMLTYTDPIDPLNSCTFIHCFSLPTCNEIGPCEFNMEDVVITCDGEDLAGNLIYDISFNIVPPPPFNNAIFSSTNGTLSGFPATVNGSGPYTGTFIDTPPQDVDVCIQVNYYDTEPVCFSFGCFRLPNCEGDPDKMNNIPADENMLMNSLKLMPNPASDEVTISYLLNKFQIGVVRIADIRGREMKENSITGVGELKINTSLFLPGIYFVTLESGNSQSIVQKLVIVKN